jgi:hypothetical protein
MQALIDQALPSLITSGPLAMVLFAAVGVLWRDNQSTRAELRAQHAEQAAFLKDLLGSKDDA